MQGEAAKTKLLKKKKITTSTEANVNLTSSLLQSEQAETKRRKKVVLGGDVLFL